MGSKNAKSLAAIARAQTFLLKQSTFAIVVGIVLAGILFTRLLSPLYRAAQLADKMTEFRETLTYPEGAIGLAIAVGPKVACVDLFDKAATCQKAWDRLLSGSILDALEENAPEGPADAKVVEEIVVELQTATWSPTPAVGEGDEFRTEFNGSIGSALLLQGTVVHANLLKAP